jgi:hypothetical protein
LLVGEGTRKNLGLDKGADLFSPLITPSSNEATQNCDWWISDTSVVLDGSRYVAQADKARDRAEWYRYSAGCAAITSMSRSMACW